MSAMIDPLLEPQPHGETRARTDSSQLQTDLGGSDTVERPLVVDGNEYAVRNQPDSGSTSPKHAPRRVVLGRVVLAVAVVLVPVLYSYTDCSHWAGKRQPPGPHRGVGPRSSPRTSGRSVREVVLRQSSRRCRRHAEPQRSASSRSGRRTRPADCHRRTERNRCIQWHSCRWRHVSCPAVSGRRRDAVELTRLAGSSPEPCDGAGRG